MKSFKQLYNRVGKAKKNTVSPFSSNRKSKKTRTIQISNDNYEHLRYDTFKHEGLKISQLANKAIEYARDHNIV